MKELSNGDKNIIRLSANNKRNFILEKELYTITDFLIDIGGSISMFIGTSILAFIITIVDKVSERFCHLYKDKELINLIKYIANIEYIDCNKYLDYSLLIKKQENIFNKQIKNLLKTIIINNKNDINLNNNSNNKSYTLILTEFREKGNIVIAYKRLK